MVSDYTPPPVTQATLKGAPYVTVSPVGLAQGLPRNNNANYGPDTPGTTTCGIQEAINANVGGGIIELLRGIFVCTSPLSIPSLSAITIKGPVAGGWQANAYPYSQYQLSNDPGGAVIDLTALSSGTAFTAQLNTANGGIAGSKVNLSDFLIKVTPGVTAMDLGGVWYGVIRNVQNTTTNVSTNPGLSATGFLFSNSGAGKVLLENCVANGFAIGFWTKSNNISFLNCETNWCGVGYYVESFGQDYTGCHDFGCGTSFLLSGGSVGSVHIGGHQREPNTTPVASWIIGVGPYYSTHTGFIGFADQINVGCYYSIDGVTIDAPFLTSGEAYVFFAFNPGPPGNGFPWNINARNIQYDSNLALAGWTANGGTMVQVKTNPPVSGTVYELTWPRNTTFYIPVTLNPTASASASAQGGIGTTSTPNVTLPAISYPAASTTGITVVYVMKVKSGYYWSITVSNATIGTIIAVDDEV